MPDEPTVPQRTIIFSGPISQNATKILRNQCCTAIVQKIQKLTIQFASEGGSVGDGFALYAFLKSLPVELTMHNTGWVGSIANVVFLAGTRRLASPHAAFLLHNLGWRVSTPTTVTSVTVHEEEMMLTSERERIKLVFKLNTQMSQLALESPDFFKEPQIYEPAAAKAAGIIHEVQDAAIPSGESVVNVDWS